jgi:lycopene cyclase domain-containing protein
MTSYRYAIILASCVAVTLPLEFLLGARVYRRPLQLLRAVAPVVLVFLAWDILATAAGHWWFSGEYTLRPRLLGLPVEEFAFFLIVPICGLLTYEAVGVLGRGRRDG